MNYDGSSIEVLEGLEAVRVRPGMYIGSTTSRGLHHCLWELIDNGVDESIAGFCNTITITLNKDNSISVEDNGRGIPVDLHPKLKIPTERVIFTVLHAGGKFKEGAYHNAGGLHGVGASVVNALSKSMKIEIYRDNKIYFDEYENGGHPLTKVSKTGTLLSIGKTNKQGTKVTFLPDDTIFETTKWDIEIIKERLKEMSYLNTGLTFSLIDNRKTQKEEFIFHSEDGISGFIKELSEENEVLTDLITFSGRTEEGIEADFALQLLKDEREHLLSFCNNIATTEGGTHITGFKSGFTRLINTYINKEFGMKETPDGRDIRNGLVAVISIKHPNPQYEGQTKTKLGNSDVKTALEEIIAKAGTLYFDRHLDDLKGIIDNSIKSLKLRQKEDLKKVSLPKDVFEISHKLADCNSKNANECEIYIVEGNSAGGNAKSARNRRTQAVLPLRGKKNCLYTSNLNNK